MGIDSLSVLKGTSSLSLIVCRVGSFEHLISHLWRVRTLHTSDAYSGSFRQLISHLLESSNAPCISIRHFGELRTSVSSLEVQSNSIPSSYFGDFERAHLSSLEEFRRHASGFRHLGASNSYSPKFGNVAMREGKRLPRGCSPR
jgi:hypothetical protein